MPQATSPVKVSVIIPCYNSDRFLAEAIDSVLRQTYPAAEIIVVDDGSTDQTREIAARYPAVKYLYQHNQGVSAARNVGLNVSQGDYLVFLDHDDRLLPDALAIGVQGLNEHLECGFAVGVCRVIRSDGIPMKSSRSSLEEPLDAPPYPTLLGGTCLNPPARFMFRRSVFREIGEFDITLRAAEDYDIYLRAAAAFPGYCHNHVVVEYREHSDSATQTLRVSNHLDASMRVFNKQWDFASKSAGYSEIYRTGKQHWCKIYGPYLAYEVASCFKKKQVVSTAKALYLLMRYYPQGMLTYSKELMLKLYQRFSLFEA
ncbi:glycosyltransferase [Phormidium tenue FACHB-886]|nr:glycosyltransferase [Phormidium tenue FACHB-886]